MDTVESLLTTGLPKIQFDYRYVTIYCVPLYLLNTLKKWATNAFTILSHSFNKTMIKLNKTIQINSKNICKWSETGGSKNTTHQEEKELFSKLLFP